MTPILEMRGITKTFPGVKALDNVNLSVMPGEIHALVGENGAGKSTLMKVLSGVYPHGSFEGEIFYDGKLARFGGIHDSEARGVIIIHQELALVPLLSIAENIFLGNEVTRGGVINWPETYARTEKLLAMVGLSEAPTARIDSLGVGKQQLVEIAKALSKKVKLLILDEPTAALQENDSQKLLDLLLDLKRQGITSILISHKLNEVSRVADRLTVLRDGATVSNIPRDDITEDRIIRDMVGRDMAHRYPARTPKIGEVLLEVSGWNVFHPQHSDRQVIRDINLHVRRGEVVGIAGLDQHDARNDRQTRVVLTPDAPADPLDALRAGQFRNRGRTMSFGPRGEWPAAGLGLLGLARFSFDRVERAQDRVSRWLQSRRRNR